MKTAYTLSQISLVVFVTTIFASVFHAEPFTWPLALGYGSLLITPLYLAIKNHSKKHIIAYSVCASAWVMGFFAKDYFLPAVFVYLVMAGLFAFMGLAWMSAMSAIIAVSVFVAVFMVGPVMPSGTAFWYKSVINLEFAALVIPAAFSFIGKPDDGAKIESREDCSGIKKAA